MLHHMKRQRIRCLHIRMLCCSNTSLNRFKRNHQSRIYSQWFKVVYQSINNVIRFPIINWTFRFQHWTSGCLWFMPKTITHSCRLRFDLLNALWLPFLLLVFVRINYNLPWVCTMGLFVLLQVLAMCSIRLLHKIVPWTKTILCSLRYENLIWNFFSKISSN